jgi:hypothetical protein
VSSKKITVSGGNISGSAIGIGDTRVINSAGAHQVTVDDLRSALAASRAEIVGLGRDEAESRTLASRIDQVADELATDEPDGDIVRGGWKSALKVLDSGAAAADSISRITQLVSSLFGS